MKAESYLVRVPSEKQKKKTRHTHPILNAFPTSKSVSRKKKKKIISHYSSPCRNDSVGVNLPVVNFFWGRAVLDAC
jgi:hypothetical protein